MWALPVDLVDGEWVVDPSPILDGDDMWRFSEVENLPTTKGTFNGKAVTVYVLDDNAGFVAAGD